MKRRSLVFVAVICAFVFSHARAQSNSPIPHLEKRDGMTKLIVDGQPFICVAGELGNSSSSDPQTMKSVWPRLASANLNTVLTVISWDLIEPQEGKFDFSMIDYQLKAARENDLRLIFLWMASWKNGMSRYTPEWVKADQKRFPRVVNAAGKSLEILSTLSSANRDADAKAFAAVMKHLREVDSKEHMVIAIQVENEVGVLGSTRDFGPAANEAFAKPVPKELMDYLQKHRESLLPELKKLWDAAGSKTSGTWEEVFGKNVARPADIPPVPNSRGRQPRPADAELLNHTDEIFMAWNYSRYIGHVAEQGKKEYPLPMYVNAWIVQTNDLGPGDYPSGGPESLVHDIWRAGAAAIDILAPDIYLAQFRQIAETFGRNGNPIFIPETGQNPMNAWMAFTEMNALCYSPFGIDGLNPESPLARAYGLINSLSGAIAEAQGKKDAIKLLTLEAGANPGRIEMGNYVFDFTAAGGRGGGFAGRGRAGASPATEPAAEAGAPARGRGGRGGQPLAFLDTTFLLMINTAPDEYYFATNSALTFRPSPNTSGPTIAAPASIDRGYFKNGKWVRQRRLNGDDVMGGGYDLSAAAANNQSGTQIPLGGRRGGGGFGAAGAAPAVEAPAAPPPPTITRVRLYRYQ